MCYQFGDAAGVRPGPIAVTGSAVQWLRDQLQIIRRRRARSRRWQPGGQRRRLLRAGFLGAVRPVLALRRPRGIVGLSRFHTKRTSRGPRWRRSATRVATWSRRWRRTRASRSTCSRWTAGSPRTRCVCRSRPTRSGSRSASPWWRRPRRWAPRTPPGLACGFWDSPEELRENWREDRRWDPQTSEDERAEGYAGWQKAAADAGLGRGGGAQRQEGVDEATRSRGPDGPRPRPQPGPGAGPATEAAAINCSRYLGFGDKNQVDAAAVDAMRRCSARSG